MSTAIRFDSVTLWRRTQEELGYDLKRLIFNIARHGFRPRRRRRVLEEVSFEIAAGEKFGLIGANGSGKSTILKLIGGILRPSSGRVAVDGRVAPLIELGAGFDLELSVADNIVYYGVFLGRDKREMRARTDAILDFAELHDYRHVPVKALSSGMTARLGFAIATEVHPEILLIDEVLSVGDESFKRRSDERLRQIWTEHATIVLVSHDIPFVAAQCDRILWVEGGRVRRLGAAAEVAKQYLEDVANREDQRRTGIAFDIPAHGKVDEARVHDGRLLLHGWSLLPDARRGSRIAVLVDGAVHGEGVYGDPRPDVAALGTPEMLECGFHADLPIGDLTPGVHDVGVVLFDPARERYHPVREGAQVTVPPAVISTLAG